jgi:hypothetical protein
MLITVGCVRLTVLLEAMGGFLVAIRPTGQAYYRALCQLWVGFQLRSDLLERSITVGWVSHILFPEVKRGLLAAIRPTRKAYHRGVCQLHCIA